MILETLFIKSLESILGGLAQAGFEHLTKVVQDKLRGTDEERRKKAFKKAFEQAKNVITNEELKPLLEQESFQAQVAVALLDPLNSFNVQTCLPEMENYPSEATYSLKRFFDTLQNTLLNDETWKPILERYQALQFENEIKEAIKQNQSELQPREVVKKLINIKDSIVIPGTMIGDIYQIYLQKQGKAELNEEQFNEILKKYVNGVRNAYDETRLYGIESMQVAKSKPVRKLSNVFIPISFRRFKPIEKDELAQEKSAKGDKIAETRIYLKLIDKKREEGEHIDVDDILLSGRKIAIIGGAGSGKSTLLAHFALTLANSILDNIRSPFGMSTKSKTLVPIIVPLRYFREYKNYCSKAPQEKVRHARIGELACFIPWQLNRRSSALALSQELFDRLLLGGGCLIMLDGLDEVTNSEERGMIRQQVENLAKDMHPENLIVVTAREAGYQKNAVFGDDFIRFDVQRLSENQINSLVEKWCSQLYPGQADKKAHELKDSIKSINELRSGRELSPLVSSPLMTTMVISVKWGETELPRERAKLYEAAVKAILQSQYIEEDEARKDLVEWGGPWEDQREWLSFLAYEMHHGGEADAVISEERVREILQKHLPQETIKKFIEAVRNRGGLFEERAELFQFTHLTFQEFLTARYLAKERNEIFNELQKCIQNSWWREVLLLTYGVAKFDYAKFAGDYLKWLSSLVGDNETQLAGLELAGSALLEIERPDADLKKEQAEKLSTYLFNPQLRVAVIQRVGAGATLARLGDPRPEATSLEGMQFFYVPEGSFIMGSNKEDDSEAFERKFPQDELTIPGFYISRFPITNEQFDAFVQAKGYENEGYWTKDGWNWKDQENIHGLRKFDSPFNLPNHPVVGVSWYEALAFTRWLNGVWKDQSILPDDLEVKIPSEAEWEKTARGGMEKPVEPMTVPIKDLRENVPPALENNPNPKRIYPWGNDPDPNLANYNDTGVGTTSAVGCFPAGISPYGCEEMSGNVWEWTRSLWGKDWSESDFKYPYKTDDRENLDAPKEIYRVLRGGCFASDCWDVRCAYRFRLNPDYGDYDVGFRIVLSPF